MKIKIEKKKTYLQLLECCSLCAWEELPSEWSSLLSSSWKK